MNLLSWWVEIDFMKNMDKLGNCTNENLIEEIFGSVSEFARQVEENGNEFKFGSVQVTHDEDKDIHTFWIWFNGFVVKLDIIRRFERRV